MRSDIIRFEFGCFPEESFSLCGHSASRGGRQCFPQPQNAREILTCDTNGAAICIDGIGSAAKAQVDRREHVPSTHIIGILRQMRFGTSYQFIDGTAIRTRRKPLDKRHGWHVGPAEKRIDAPGDQRHCKHSQKSQQPPRRRFACSFRSFPC